MAPSPPASPEQSGGSPLPGEVSPLAFLAGGGELGERMRREGLVEAPASAPPEDWPQSLKTAVRIMLTSRQPIWIGWGPELVYLYNDPYQSADHRRQSTPQAPRAADEGRLARNLGRRRSDALDRDGG